ncbi:MAG TPA: hypothetical protein VFS22_10655 [Flavisolibacter sp.]|nr:hypothetical protein [Flavisolibacter sp.]
MGTFLSYAQTSSHFSVSYPYYGLFGTADVRLLQTEDEPLFECKLVNGAIILLKKLDNTRKWIDAQLNRETPLSSVIGMYIDDFIKEE